MHNSSFFHCILQVHCKTTWNLYFYFMQANSFYIIFQMQAEVFSWITESLIQTSQHTVVLWDVGPHWVPESLRYPGSVSHLITQLGIVTSLPLHDNALVAQPQVPTSLTRVIWDISDAFAHLEVLNSTRTWMCNNSLFQHDCKVFYVFFCITVMLIAKTWGCHIQGRFCSFGVQKADSCKITEDGS